MSTMAPRPAQPTSIPVFRRILVYGSVLAAGIAVVGAVVGGLAAGAEGVVSALIGTLLSVVFMGITAGSILVANRFAGTAAAIGAFFGIVMGGWLVKFVVFLVLMVLLKDQPWIQPVVLFLSIIAGVVGSLLVDVFVLMKSRMTYASDITLPTAAHDD
ncbi:hypothetical protein E3T26_09965 [Cryobacterium sp. TMT1-21]|uniref:Uncharacterized protein n=1 Tax=Cryobacterium shii TaxID=1259235 RepID=A0AAQ2C491_9MICO|nr:MULTISPECIES: hypothetical protein [Cryobacterium]TFC42528.1 hypothetical protein E3O49_14385 [Cryobacterium shii]TFD13213.1 hypothetical protein E3T26_09965 [Cryobacterium sp. TMT1-21]TFD18634.1 hypothetical protein E3T42_05255 [Cryobacterium sp. TMT4-10]TFD28434.1 hypothetical protein E3T32_00780 [Cryobacterium sp. TMT2-23]TFD36642.1 hypothetical protein E3T37_13550 [Cryobacterium sp. TMT2-10]